MKLKEFFRGRSFEDAYCRRTKIKCGTRDCGDCELDLFIWRFGEIEVIDTRPPIEYGELISYKDAEKELTEKEESKVSKKNTDSTISGEVVLTEKEDHEEKRLEICKKNGLEAFKIIQDSKKGTENKEVIIQDLIMEYCRRMNCQDNCSKCRLGIFGAHYDLFEVHKPTTKPSKDKVKTDNKEKEVILTKIEPKEKEAKDLKDLKDIKEIKVSSTTKETIGVKEVKIGDVVKSKTSTKAKASDKAKASGKAKTPAKKTSTSSKTTASKKAVNTPKIDKPKATVKLKIGDKKTSDIVALEKVNLISELLEEPKIDSKPMPKTESSKTGSGVKGGNEVSSKNKKKELVVVTGSAPKEATVVLTPKDPTCISIK